MPERMVGSRVIRDRGEEKKQEANGGKRKL